MGIVLQKIDIEREDWGEKKGQYKGSVRINVKNNTFWFILPDHRVKEMLRLIKPDIFAWINEAGEESLRELENYLNG